MSQHKKRGFGAVFVAMAWCTVVSAQELSNSDMQGSSPSAEVSSEGSYTSSPEGVSDSSASSNSSCEYVDPAIEVIDADSPEVTAGLAEEQPHAAARADVPNDVRYTTDKWCPGDIIKNDDNLCEMFVVGTTKTISGDCTEFACRPTGKTDKEWPEGCPQLSKKFPGPRAGCYANRHSKLVPDPENRGKLKEVWTVTCTCQKSTLGCSGVEG